MAASGRAVFRSVLVALALALSALVLPSGMHQALAAANVGVNCDSGGDLNTPLFDVDPGGTVTVIGTCTGNFTINKPMTLQGGTIHGSGGGPALTVSPGSGLVTIQNLTISNGSGASGNNGLPLPTFDDGGTGGPGGLDIENGTVDVENVTITNNRGGDGGEGETIGIPKSKLSVGGNGGRGGVGGVLINGGTVTFHHVTVSDNTPGNGGDAADGVASAGNGGNAGTAGVEVGSGTVTVENSVIEDNNGGDSQGGVGGSSGGPSGNGGDGGPGGLYVRGGSVNVIESTITGNVGSQGQVAGPVSVFTDRGTYGRGGTGGIFMSGGTAGLYNTTLAGNTGGLPGRDSSTVVCTTPNDCHWQDPAGHSGDGATRAGSGSTLALVYSTIWNNLPGDAWDGGTPGAANGGGTTTGTASIVQDCSGAFDDQGDNAFGNNTCVDPVNGATSGTVVGGVSLQDLKNGTNSTPLMPENSDSSSIGNISQADCNAGIPGPSGSGIPNLSGSGDLIFADQRGISRAHRNCDAGAFQTLATPTVDLLHDDTDDTGISQTDDVTSNSRPTLKGQLIGGTGLTATVYDNGRSIGTAVVGGTLGNNDFFFVRPTSALSDGVHTITASVQDPDSGQSVTSAPSKVTVETGAPNVFIVPKSQPFSDSGIYVPDAGGNTLTVTVGVSDPSGVTALSCTDGSTNVASISNASASPQITHDVTLKSGAHAISCTGTGAAGNQGSLTQSFYVRRTLSIFVGGGTDEDGVTTLSAALGDDQGNAVDGKTITFFVQDKSNPDNWIQVCGVTGQPGCPTTQLVSSGGTIDGDAVLTGVSMPSGYAQQLTDQNYPGAIKATFAGDAQDSPVSATATLGVSARIGGNVFDCPTSEAALQNDITNAGKLGTVHLYCRHDTTIPFTSPISLTTTTIQSYGPGRVIFDGGGQTQLFDVPSPAPGQGSQVAIEHVTLQNGMASDTHGGGAVEIDAGTFVTLGFDTFINNGPNDIASAGTTTVGESTFSDTGAALYNTGTASLFGSTLSGDTNFGSGDAAIVNTSGATLTLAATIVANAAGGSGANCAIAGDSTFHDSGNNLEWSGAGGTDTCGLTGGSEGPDITGQNPLLGPLQDNSSRTGPETMALLPGSPAIDKVPLNTTACVSGDSDERDVQRPQNGLCDIGAYEYLPTPPPSLSAVGATATYNLGNPVSANFTASLKVASNTGLYGRRVFFSVSDGHGHWTPVCGDPGQVDCPTTDTNGVATLDGIDLTSSVASADVDAGSYSGVVRAQFTGDTTTNAATGTGDLDVSQAQNVVSLSFSSPSFPLPIQTYGNPGFDLADFSTHSAGAAITFDSQTPDVCTTSAGSTFLTIVGVGTCTVQASAPGDTNHIDAVPVEASFPVLPRQLVVQASGGPMVQGGTPPVITPIIDPNSFVPGDTAATALSGAFDCSTTATSSSAPGPYPSTCAQGTLGSVDYSFTFVNGTVNIQQPTATINLDASTLNPVYNATPRRVTATTNPAGLPYSVSYTDANGNPTGAPTAPGVYTVTAQITDPSQTALPVTGTLFLHKAVLEVTCDDQSITSSGSIPTLTYKIKGNFVGNDTSSVVSGTPSCSTPATSTSAPGTYPIVADVSGLTATNYSIVRGPDGTLTVTQPVAAITLDASTLSPTYDGGPQAVTATTTPSGLGYAVTYIGAGNTSYGPSTTPPTDAGSYSVDASITDPGYSASDAMGTLTVNKADQTISVATTAPSSAPYNSQFTVAATAPGGNVTYGSSGACTRSGATYTMTAGAGTCTVTFDQPGDGNYNSAPQVKETVSAAKVQLTITANDQAVQYSDHLPTLTVKYSGFSPNDGPPSLGGNLTCSTAATVNSSGQVLSPAGTYAITCSGQTSSNYAITYTAGTLTVTPENAVAKLASNNPHDLQVTKAGGNAPQFTLGATITEASDGSYGDIAKARPITFSLTPIGGGPGYSCTVPSTLGSVTKTLVATATSPGSETVSCTFPAGKVGVNVYDVNVSVGGTNYTGSTDGTLTVFDTSDAGVQWGGGTVVNPATGNTASVAFSASYNSSGGVVGKLIYIETDSNGNQTVFKGNNLATMAITKSSTGGYPETAIITGKGVLNGVGNYSFVVTAVDANGGTGSDADTFGIQVKDQTGAQVPSLWYLAAQRIASGNIFIK